MSQNPKPDSSKPADLIAKRLSDKAKENLRKAWEATYQGPGGTKMWIDSIYKLEAWCWLFVGFLLGIIFMFVVRM